MNKHRTHNADGVPYTLKADVKTSFYGSDITLPEGAAVVWVEGNGGGFALASTKLLIKLTGNTHDPVYRYAWVNREQVNGAEPAESWPKVRPDRVEPVDPTQDEAGRINAGCANVYLAALIGEALDRARTGQRLNALDIAALDEAQTRIDENANENDDAESYYGPDGPPADILADDA